MIISRHVETVVAALLVFWTLNFLRLVTAASYLPGPPKIVGKEFRRLQVGSPGEEFRILCPIQSTPPPHLQWFKDGEPMSGSWSRVRISEGSLRVRSLETSDSGIYECKGSNGHGSIIARTRLIVSSASPEDEEEEESGRQSELFEEVGTPHFTPETTAQPASIQIKAGGSVAVKCHATGIPPPKLMWLKDGRSVSGRERSARWSLLLRELSAEDAGVYTCTATNPFGTNEISIRVAVTDVVARSRPNFLSTAPNNVTVDEGEEASFSCIVSGDSSPIAPHIRWLKQVEQEQQEDHSAADKHLITVHDKHFLVIQASEWPSVDVESSEGRGVFVSRLKISRTVLGVHEGLYVCLATNSLGYSYRNALLTLRPRANEEAAERATTGESSSHWSSPSIFPFPALLFLLSALLSVLVVSAACCLKNYSKGAFFAPPVPPAEGTLRGGNPLGKPHTNSTALPCDSTAIWKLGRRPASGKKSLPPPILCSGGVGPLCRCPFCQGASSEAPFDCCNCEPCPCVISS